MKTPSHGGGRSRPGPGCSALSPPSLRLLWWSQFGCWEIAGHAKPGTDQANARLDAVPTGLAAGAGAGAAVGLMLAFRRQHHQEVTTALSDHDATERRITELYTNAVEQLGNDKAPVRLGGLYALERLAQDNSEQRQTIVNVICAYLRMPFSPTASIKEPEPEVAEEASGEPAAGTEARTVALGDTWHQERQVRLTAQRILAEHLRDDRAKDHQSTDVSHSRSWPSIRLDLVGATLIDFDFRDCLMADPDFYGATFSGDALFDGATFSGTAWFGAATFSGDAWFGGATFSGDAWFGGAIFSGDAYFDRATFTGAARFDRATFTGGGNGMSLEQSRVLSPSAHYVWPTGWCLGPDDSGGHTVVRANGNGHP